MPNVSRWQRNPIHSISHYGKCSSDCQANGLTEFCSRFMIIESWCTLCVTLHSGTSGEQTSSKLCGSAGVIAPLQSPVLKTGVPSQQASAGHPLVDFVLNTLQIRRCLLFPVKTREGFGQACSAYMGGRRSFIEGIAGLAGIQRGGAVHVSWNVWCVAPEFSKKCPYHTD